MTPQEIENKSLQIITDKLAKDNITLLPQNSDIIKRVIHTTANYNYAKTLLFSPNVVDYILSILKAKIPPIIITDTKMAQVGINAFNAKKLHIKIYTYINSFIVKKIANKLNTTRSSIAIKYACKKHKKHPLIFAIGNAPTALTTLLELVNKNCIKPALIIGVPVGFVNVIKAKEQLIHSDIPYITCTGNTGGSTVAVAICNALLKLALA